MPPPTMVDVEGLTILVAASVDRLTERLAGRIAAPLRHGARVRVGELELPLVNLAQRPGVPLICKLPKFFDAVSAPPFGMTKRGG